MNDKKYPDLAVAILAGGASSRFGADKALIQLDPVGPTLLENTVTLAQTFSDRVIVVGHERYRSVLPEIPIVSDEMPDQGPLAGIATALRHLDRQWVLVLGCDMPCLSPALLRWMIERRSSPDAVVPRTADGHWQTLHSLYRQSILPEVDATLSEGMRSIRSLLGRIVVDEITESQMRAIDPALDSLFSLNSPDDLARARSCASKHRVDTVRRMIS